MEFRQDKYHYHTASRTKAPGYCLGDRCPDVCKGGGVPIYENKIVFGPVDRTQTTLVQGMHVRLFRKHICYRCCQTLFEPNLIDVTYYRRSQRNWFNSP